MKTKIDSKNFSEFSEQYQQWSDKFEKKVGIERIYERSMFERVADKIIFAECHPTTVCDFTFVPLKKY